MDTNEKFAKLIEEAGHLHIKMSSVMMAASEVILEDLPQYAPRNEAEISAAKDVIKLMADPIQKVDPGIVALELLQFMWDEMDNPALMAWTLGAIQ